jgi:hypothetical protein
MLEWCVGDAVVGRHSTEDERLQYDVKNDERENSRLS